MNKHLYSIYALEFLIDKKQFHKTDTDELNGTWKSLGTNKKLKN